jgi:hypothetical protein
VPAEHHDRAKVRIMSAVEHNTDYAVYENAEACGCVIPDEEASEEAYDAWRDDHPTGVTANGDTLQICHRTELGTYCEECSHNNGDWIQHLTYCDECEYPLEDDGTCQCEPEEAAS